jgi:hypothetical protein
VLAYSSFALHFEPLARSFGRRPRGFINLLARHAAFILLIPPFLDLDEHSLLPLSSYQ